MKKYCYFLIVCIVIVFTACAVKSTSAHNATGIASAEYPKPEARMDTNEAGFDQGDMRAQTMKGEDTNVELITDTRKIIYEAYIDLEAIDFEKSIADTVEALKQTGGYIASESIEGRLDSISRRASYELRVPQKNYQSFLAMVSDAGNIVSQTQSSQDVTSAYVDVQARLKSLRLQEERLLEMMSKAGELDTLLAIQNQLTEVTYNIERHESQKKLFDNRIEYSTVRLEISQVERITENKDGFAQRVKVAFGETWTNFVKSCQDIFVGVVYVLPLMIILAILLTAFIVIVNRKSKKLNQVKHSPIKPQDDQQH